MVSTKGVVSVLKTKTKIVCKSIALERLTSNKDCCIAILCRTNRIADDITDYLRRAQKFEGNRKLPPIDCARLGVENSPYEESRRIILQLHGKVDLREKNMEILQGHLANDLLRKLLPCLPQNELPACGIRSKGKNKERWIGAGEVASTMAANFGLGLVKLRDYLRGQAVTYNCRSDKLTANCIGYVGNAIQRIGKRTWQNMSGERKRQKIDAIIAQYESASAGRSERLAVMTVHQSKGREFDTVVIPWFAKIDWTEGDFGSWDTTDPETKNVFHTACTRAKDEAIVVRPHGCKAMWPPR